MLGEGIAAGLRAIGRKPRVLGYVERDAYAASVLLARMESKALEPAPVWAGNLEAVRWEQFTGFVDVVAAGFPCQPHSHAGSRKGTDDHRWIWPAIAECIRVVRPGIVYLENVAGLRSSGGMAPVLADLAALGFRIEWDSIRASDVGASHQRERVFILGYSERNGWNSRWPEQQGRKQRGANAHCAGGAVGYPRLQHIDLQQRCERAEHQRTGCVMADSGSARSAPRVSGSDAGNKGNAGIALDCRHADELANTRRPRLQGIEQQSSHEPDGRTDGRSRNHADQLPNFVMYRFSHQDQTMNDGPTSLPKDPTSRRRLNPQFVDWMMGWPPGWTSTEPTDLDAEEMVSWHFKLDSHLSRLLAEPESLRRTA